ncbi:non-hydrolyzing UDP-N-acetylglucosamine 2-epimerase [Achromobacter marplatensis]|jgi:UDP-GlcNAc3NAcA epimerase|uniref:UDP-N-acetylglucosamine 2-epimerase (Non-hydrolyzing) n=1 Tax=Achromobacter marplatensis TaxID=470868 RepID=A0AA42WEG8_9BURK|nr:UDP-N-acetylglucosamine 2-epimerase (non-hydrolyzing) [Achromobacter marplatensis]EJO31104.1 UDP-N-acetylglucosamine 2-epimerase [Achromobacter marplatensis]MDH2052928.1 UDP-N-acetylglucosamine 2-epimerase (non-hydrolyzing) [Achromobacter marplatensis]
MTKKILTVLGARPQFIKASVVSAAIARHPQLSEVLVHTGQHFDANMSDVFFDELGMKQPEHQLDIHGGGHGEMTGRMLIELERVVQDERPDAVLVYGDTNSTLAGALVAAKLHIPVAHVEAGLRSFNMRMPEEVNRVLTDRVSRWLYTPTDTATAHLIREGMDPSRIIQVGDVMLDVARFQGTRVNAEGGALARFGLTPGQYILVTIHRAENTDDPQRLGIIVDALMQVGADHEVVWPLHPRTRNILEKLGLRDKLASRIKLVEPVGYLDMVQLEKYCKLVLTDSGGVQKEAFFHERPCVTVRDETEWTELVDAGWNRLAPPTSVEGILSAIGMALTHQPTPTSPYGDGSAADKIAESLAE